VVPNQLLFQKGMENKNLVSDFQPENLAYIVAQDYGETKWIINGMIPREGITIVSARPKAGKSWFVLYMLLKAVRGEEVFGMETSPSKILFIDEEGTLRGMQRRAKKITDNFSSLNFRVLNKGSFKIDKDEDREWLKIYVHIHKIDLVVFDSFRRIHTAEENDSGQMTNVYDYLKDLMTEDVAVLLIHHNKKLQKFEKANNIDSVRGSSDIVAMVESFILLDTKDAKDGDSKDTYVNVVVRENADVAPFKVNWRDSADGKSIIFNNLGEIDTSQSKLVEAEGLIETLLEKGEVLTKDDICAMLVGQVGENSVRKALVSLEKNKTITSVRGGEKGRKKVYSINQQTSIMSEEDVSKMFEGDL